MKSASWLTPNGFVAVCAANTTTVIGERERLADYTQTVTEVPSGSGWPKLSKDLQESWEHLLRACWSASKSLANTEILYGRERLTPETLTAVKSQIYLITLTYDSRARDTRAQLDKARAAAGG